MKTSTFPAINLSPARLQAAEEILQEGETLSSFVEQAIRENIECRQLHQTFIAHALNSRDKARQNGRYVSTEAVMGRLEEMLTTSQRTR